MRRRQTAIVVLLFIGYAGFYFCRANLPVAAPLIIADLRVHGMSVNAATLEIGALASLGTLAYAFGKFFLAGLADFFGGKRSLLLGMAGAMSFTALFALSGGPPMYVAAWIGNRLFQSLGWPGVVKVTSKWFDFTSYGSVMAVLSLSFLVGDVFVRSSMGLLIGIGTGWRELFLIGVAAFAVLFLANLVALTESSVEAGFPPPKINPLNAFGPTGSEDRPAHLRSLLQPLLRSKAFWIVCALSFGTTLLRETFNTWTPTYFTTYAGFRPGQAASYSALFPAAGVISVLGAGWLSDRLGPIGRARITFAGLLLAACTMAALGFVPKGSGLLAVALVAAAGFFNSGPYSYLAGAMALDFGGRKGSATSSGVIDGAGYIGGALAGVAVARVEIAFGWGAAFLSLAAVTLITAACGALLELVQRNELNNRFD